MGHNLSFFFLFFFSGGGSCLDIDGCQMMKLMFAEAWVSGGNFLNKTMMDFVAMIDISFHGKSVCSIQCCFIV